MIIAEGCVPPRHEREIAFELRRCWENRPRTLEGSGRRAATDPPASSRRNDRGTPTGRRGRFKPIQGESRQLRVKKLFYDKDQSSETPNPMNASACHELRLPSSNAGQTPVKPGQSESNHSQLLMLRWNGSHQIALNRTTLPGHGHGRAAGQNPAGRDPNTDNHYQPQHVDRESGRVVRARHGRPRCHPNTIPSAPKRVRTRQGVDLGWQGASKGGLAVEKKRLRNHLRRGFAGLLPFLPRWSRPRCDHGISQRGHTTFSEIFTSNGLKPVKPDQSGSNLPAGCSRRVRARIGGVVCG